MATLIKDPVPQSLLEIRSRTCDYTADLPTGVTVSSATATHLPPSGAAATASVAVATPLVNVNLGPLSVKGEHALSVLATYSDGQKSEIRIVFNVEF